MSEEIGKGRARSDLAWLFAPLDEIPEFVGIAAALDEKGVYAAHGLDETQRLHMLAGLQRKTGRLLVLVVPTEQAALRAADDLSVLLNGRVATLPAREPSFQRVAAASHELSVRRIEALGAALAGGLRALVASVSALTFPLMPRRRFLERVIRLQAGERMEPFALVERLVRAGYERVDVAESRGQCALRGGIVDVYPVGRLSGLRVEFFDDEIDSLRDFDPLSQRSVREVERAILLPAREVLLSPEEARDAAGRLRAALERASKRSASASASRRRAIEREFDLPPWEEFEMQVAAEEGERQDELPALSDMGKPRALMGCAPRTDLERQFAPAVDALLQGGLSPNAEMLMPFLYEDAEDVADYLPEALFALDQPDRLRESCENRLLEFQEQFKAALETEQALPEQGALPMDYERLLARLTAGRAVTITPFARSFEGILPRALFRFDALSGAQYHGNLKEMTRDLRAWKSGNWRAVLLAGGVARSQRLAQSLDDLRCPVPYMENVPDALPAGQPLIAAVALSRGFQYPGIRFAVVTETDIFGIGRQKGRAAFRAGEKLAAFTDLAVGDYVVHETYGIGQYMGTIRLQVDGAWGDYLHIRYQGTDKLYVPTDQLDRVQKYIGSEGSAPRINRLSGNEWQKQKARVKADIQEIAGELVKLYAQRQATPGYAFSPDTPWQREFEDDFEFDETEDQLQAIEEIKRDMAAPKVMDRLLCGDVGYGKTEVALRAIFKAVNDGKQAALLAPTTILVQQHLNTMRKRFGSFPIRVDTLSRFRTAGEQKAVVGALKRGEIDVIVGTHRLLGKDVAYKDLGLLVIDEEQRFGVKHKETIKQLRHSVDVLTLSATPIPRTLHMSMVGIRDMSLLRMPPEERFPVQTYVVEYSDALVRDAILREIAREGQVYVLYNRVRSIERFYERLHKLVPEARIAVGHGQMREHALEDVMMDFYDGKFDVLLCTTIIEAGLDVPRANTLIVVDADRFGLAQLYQIRGRVGRSNRLAYAYLTVTPNKVLSETADRRLSAIREFTEFGSGFRVAMRDMEIRGTGNLFGSQQSGHMASVGYDLYVKMIEESVRELRGDASQGDIQTKMEIKLDAYLPAEYVPNDQMRIEIYKKIAAIDGASARADLIEELIDRFGEPKGPVMNLIEIGHLKGLCERIGIECVSARQGQLLMRFSANAQVDPAALIEGVQAQAKALILQPTTPPGLVLRGGNQPIDELVRRAVPVMEELVDRIAPAARAE